MQGLANELKKDPAQILGLNGEVDVDILNEAYKTCLRTWEDARVNNRLAELDFTRDELEWAYREILSLIELQGATHDEDSIVSAGLIPGLSNEALQAVGGGQNVVYLARQRSPQASPPPQTQAVFIQSPAATTTSSSMPDIDALPHNPLNFPELRDALATSRSGASHQQAGTYPDAKHRRIKALAGESEKAIVPIRSHAAHSSDAQRRLLTIIETTEQPSGALLKKLRLEMGVTLEELSLRTKIGKQHLEALENDVYELLPAIVYVRGFIVSYLRYLGVERDDLVEAITENYRARLRMQARNSMR